MATYFVHIPDTQAPTAEVEASNTKHARTAYLDYLSRNGLIEWSQRQAVRPYIKVNSMSPGDVQTAVKLEYSHKGALLSSGTGEDLEEDRGIIFGEGEEEEENYLGSTSYQRVSMPVPSGRATMPTSASSQLATSVASQPRSNLSPLLSPSRAASSYAMSVPSTSSSASPSTHSLKELVLPPPRASRQVIGMATLPNRNSLKEGLSLPTRSSSQGSNSPIMSFSKRSLGG
jgi:hypothetical protein